MTGVFFGCTLLLQEDLKRSLETFLNKINLDYEPIGIDECCGIPLILSGFIDEAKKHGEKVLKKLKDKNIDKIITHCPHCYTAFKHEYPEKLDINHNIPVFHFTQFVWDLIKNGRIKLEKKVNLKIVYHDPCYIGRQGDQIFEEPRSILNCINGITLVEFEMNRDASTCCGGGGLLRAVYPKLSLEVSKEKIELQAKPLGVDAIVSCCPFCDVNLKEGVEELKTDIKVYDIVNMLEEAL